MERKVIQFSQLFDAQSINNAEPIMQFANLSEFKASLFLYKFNPTKHIYEYSVFAPKRHKEKQESKMWCLSGPACHKSCNMT